MYVEVWHDSVDRTRWFESTVQPQRSKVAKPWRASRVPARILSCFNARTHINLGACPASHIKDRQVSQTRTWHQPPTNAYWTGNRNQFHTISADTGLPRSSETHSCFNTSYFAPQYKVLQSTTCEKGTITHCCNNFERLWKPKAILLNLQYLIPESIAQIDSQ